ncbi:MAG: peptide MFS transporter [Myxococcales bacterium]
MSSPLPPSKVPVRGHPPGLYLLFTTEMWERMSYYGMRALLVLYMVDKQRGGFGWDQKWALQVYGLYTGLVYLTPVAGGYLADRYLGQRRAVTIGGVLMMLGHFLMAVPGVAAFYAALALLILGNGMFKPNISTMVGGLYQQGDPRRDGAFTIFYMGINLGAFLSPLVCGTLGEKFGWHWGFGAAGVGMGLGLLAFLLGQKKLLGDVGLAPAPRTAASVAAEKSVKLTGVEIDRVLVILILSIFVIFFWAAFEQAGGLMNLYTDEKVDRVVFGWEVPTTWFQAINPAIIVLLGPVFSVIWTGLAKRNLDPPTPVKMALGLILLSFGFVLMMGASKQSEAVGKAGIYWIVGAYFFHTVGELCLSPVGLSMVTKLAPAKFASLLMGVWFLSSSVANYLAGFIGGFSKELGEFQLFGAIVVATAVAGVVLLAVSRRIRRMMHGADDTESAALANPEGGPSLSQSS